MIEYFTHLSILWDELQNYEPLPTCSCEKCVCNVNEKISNIPHREAIMQFLMGLNDFFSHIRGKILLMDPIPSVEKVFSLLIQDEKQRSVRQGNNNGLLWSLLLLQLRVLALVPRITRVKIRKGPSVVTVVCKVILWRSFTNSIDILLVTKPKAKLLWLIKFLLTLVLKIHFFMHNHKLSFLSL